MNAIPAKLYGLVLGGGLSSRMGMDKGELHYYDKPQREYVFNLLQKFCAQVYQSIGKSTGKTTVVNPIKDVFPFNSPLNGILSAFQQHSDVAWLTIPVDMPLVNEQSIQFLINHRDTQSVATCFYDSEGKLPEPLLTIWEPKSFRLLSDFMATGKISPRDFLASNKPKLLNAPDKNVLRNVNTPEDFEAVLRDVKKP